MLKAFNIALKRADHGKNRLALLNRLNPAGSKAAAVAQRINLIDDRQISVARTQKVAMHRMHMAVRVNSLTGRRQRLTQNLPTEQLLETEILTAATEQVFLDFLQCQQVYQIIQQFAHSGSSHIAPPLTDGYVLTVMAAGSPRKWPPV